MKAPVATTTAGLRGAQWKTQSLPADVQVLPVTLQTEDGAAVTGFLFSRGKERTVVCAMHPREMLVTQYLVPEVLKAGCAVWVMGSRTAGNDLRLEHEKAVIDLAAGQCFLRERGFEKTVLLGTSGGGPLAAFYIQQAGLVCEQRIGRSPAGRPTGLPEAALPMPDALVLVSAHLGQGPLLMNCIDPSVVDEGNPLEVDSGLCAFEPSNGFRPPPESSRYDPAFLKRYRAAQRERVVRIDGSAKELVNRRLEAKRRSKTSRTGVDAALAAHSPVFTVWRTDADPRCYDLSLEPSDRAYGSLWGPDPMASNYGSVGFARVCTPEGWLSNWSALSSNATMAKCAPCVKLPTLVVQYTGDNSVFPSEADTLYELLGASDKRRHKVLGNHHGQPIIEGSHSGQSEAGRLIREWLAHQSLAIA